MYIYKTNQILSVLTWAFVDRGEKVSKSARNLSIDNLITGMASQRLEDCLLNKSGDVALHTRFRALFTLKSLKSEDAVEIIAKGGSYNFHFYAY